MMIIVTTKIFFELFNIEIDWLLSSSYVWFFIDYLKEIIFLVKLLIIVWPNGMYDAPYLREREREREENGVRRGMMWIR